MRIGTLAVVGVALVLSGLGCKIGPNQPYPARDRFGLQAVGVTVAGAEAGGAGSVAGGVIRVDRVQVAPPFDQRALVYRTTDLQYESDYFNQFVASPSDLLSAEITAGLTSSGRFTHVLTSDSLASTSVRLDLTVTRLNGDFRVSGKPAAAISIRAVLIEVTDSGTRVVAQRMFEESEPIGSTAAPELVAGWGKALGRAINQLTVWSKENLPK